MHTQMVSLYIYTGSGIHSQPDTTRLHKYPRMHSHVHMQVVVKQTSSVLGVLACSCTYVIVYMLIEAHSLACMRDRM